MGLLNRVNSQYQPLQRLASTICIYVLLCINVFSFARRHCFLFRWRVFSRVVGSGALGSRARREPIRTPGRKCGPWPRSVTRALGGQSHEMANNYGEVFRAPRAIKAHVNPRTCSKNVRRVAHVVQISADGSHWLPAHLVLIFECSSSCSSAFVLMLECSRPCSRVHVLTPLHLAVVFECCRARSCDRVLVVRRVGKEKYMYAEHLSSSYI